MTENSTPPNNDPHIKVSSPAPNKVLTFTPLNWKTPQTVTLRADDDPDSIAGTRLIGHVAGGGGYPTSPNNAVIKAILLATEIENDQSIVLSPTNNALNVSEGGSATYTVKLNLAPSANVNVALTATGDADITFSPSSLAFTTDNWSAAQTVTVSAGQDNDVGNGTKVITHRATSTDANYNNGVASLTVTEQDDDTGSAAVVLRNAADNANITALNVTEEDTNGASYKVKLSHQPGKNVTVTLSGNADGDADITFSPASLTFTTTNYSTAQTVTVSAAADNTDVGNGTKTITHSASDGGYDDKSATLTATELDNDTASAAITLSPTTVGVNENGTGTYTVKLSHKPGADVNVNIARAQTGDDDITVKDTDDGTTGDQTGAITFTPANYATARTVTLHAADDSDKVQGSRDIIHTVQAASGGYGASVTATLTATEIENDGAIIFQDAANANITGLDVPENGTAAYKIKLSQQPSADVTVAISAGSGDSDITVKDTNDSQTGDQTTDITFTTGNWNTARTVILAAASDTGATDGSRTITHTATSTDANYSGATGTLTAKELDDDKTIILMDSGGSNDISSIIVVENATVTYKVKLGHQPSGGDVTVTLAVSDETNSDISVSPTSLTFTSDNWSSLQTVTITAATDSDTTNGTATITHTASGGRFHNITAALTVKENDNGNNVTPSGEDEAPGNVGSVSASRSGGSIAASWNAPDGATKYHVTYTTDGGSSWSLAASAHDTNSISIANADSGKEYKVGVRAGNDHGWSGWINSNTVPAQQQQQPANPPASVSGLSASRSGGNITASWNAPDGATKYHVTYTTDGGSSWSLAASAHTSTSISINAANDKAYIVGVRAGNDAGWSGWVNSNEVPKVVTPPASVGSVSATHNGGNVSASWNAVSGATKYHVTYSTDGGGSWSLAALEHATNSITIANADSAKTYIVGVRAGNSAGWSGWVNSPPASN